jgi:signal transduction histidine kinase
MQEALSNAVRHGARERVTVTLDLAPALATLVVLDDGPGFPEDSASRLRSRGGLAGIRERVTALGGHLTIGNGEGGGARVEVCVPVSDEPQAHDEDTR